MTGNGASSRIANVVVTSQSPYGLRVLLLHPSDVETLDGDWSWGPPGGNREPREDIATCAARELAEETGIRAVPHVVRLGEFAVFRLEVPWGTAVRLSDEHTRYEWVTVAEAHRRCRPAPLLDAVRTGLAAG